MTYNNLLRIAEVENIEVFEFDFSENIKALYCDNNIGISPDIETTKEKKCILAEELGHYYTSSGDITDQNDLRNKKQELTARRWAHKKLLPLEKIIKGSFTGCRNLYELADHLDVTEEFLTEALQQYKMEYGLYAEVDDYCIYFEPLTVCRYKYD